MIGATAACALVQRGLRVTVVEAREVDSSFTTKADYDLRVSAISPGTEMILHAVGAWPAIEAMRVCPYRRMTVWDAEGFGEIHFDSAQLNEPCLGFIVENRVIQHALTERMKNLDEITLRCPHVLQGFDVQRNGIVVELESGERIQARLLIGADGSNSRVRSLAGIVFNAREYRQRAVVATVATELPHAYTAWQRFLADGVLAFLPLADGRCSIVWSTSAQRAHSLVAMDDDGFCDALTRAFDRRLGRILATGRRASFPIRGGQAGFYVLPRLALIGDAAHCIHPLAGQGANLGFADAAVLAEILTRTSRDIGSLRVLRQYERARKGENVAMMRAMEGFMWLFSTQTLPVRWLRNVGLALCDAATPVKRELMRHAMGLSGERLRPVREYS